MKIATFALLAFLAAPAAMLPVMPAAAQTATDCAAQIASQRRMQLTVDSMKENMQWMRARTS